MNFKNIFLNKYFFQIFMNLSDWVDSERKYIISKQVRASFFFLLVLEFLYAAPEYSVSLCFVFYYCKIRESDMYLRLARN